MGDGESMQVQYVILGALTWLLLGCSKVPEPSVEWAKQDPSSAQSTSKAPDFEPTVLANVAPPAEAPSGMVWVPGGEFSMGSSVAGEAAGHCHEPQDDARPIHRVRVSGFFMDATEVTNAQFAQFVEATGYVTVAERIPTAEELPGVPDELRVAGSTVFTPPAHATATQPMNWWRFVPGANWRQPGGPGTSIADRAEHPVVHIAHADALAYATWAGKDLPTEAEWEFAARGGKTGQLYPWGNNFDEGTHANTFQGVFPTKDTARDGYAGTAPAGTYAPNGFGLYDMAGNVWEWTLDWYRVDTYRTDARSGVVVNPKGPLDSLDPAEPGTKKRVQRGGSFLCTDQYCTRYMVGTRGKGEPNSPASHTGFRCVKRVNALSPVL